MNVVPFRCLIPLVGGLLLLAGCSPPDPLKAGKKPVTTEYHGIKVQDDYQWLEDAANPEVRKWSAAQNGRARAALDRLPVRAFLEARLQRLLGQTSADYFALSWRQGKLFALKFQAPAQQPVLLALDSLDNLKGAKLVVDPNTLSTNGSTAIDWYVPSRDGQLVAVSLSQGGSEAGTLFIYETATGQRRADVVPRVQFPTGGGSAAWNADGSGIFYTRYPQKGERPEADLDFYQQVYFHKLGAPPEEDRYEFGKDLPRIAEIVLEASPDGRNLLATVANGDGGEYAHYLRETGGGWRQVTRFEDKVKQVEFGRDPVYVEFPKDDALYLRSTLNAPKGKILRLPLTEPDLTRASTVLREGTNSIQDFKPAASGLYVVLLKGGPSELVFVDLTQPSTHRFTGDNHGPNFKIPTAVEQMLVTRADQVLVRTETYTEPYAWWQYDPNRDKDKMERTALAGVSPVAFDDVEVVRTVATSKDGTPVPLSILRRKGLHLDGENPALLTGYGGYGVSRTPRFDAARRVWFDQGGVLAVANLRGGGEFGEEWHRAGNLTRKQNVFDDFAACAELLVRSNYTKPSKLAIEGGSNGGLLMGAMLTQHPDLMQAVVSHVGIYDMLRVEQDPNGAFNVTEFGSVKDRDQFLALYAYSPYHHVQERTAYPAVLMLTGENDGRVNPAHSRKMTARLQAATNSKRPVLLRTSSNSGHGMGTALDERIQQLADVYSFLLEQLGIDYTLVERGPWSGALTPASAVVKAKLPLDDMSTRLAVSEEPLFVHATFTAPVRSEGEHYDIVEFSPQNLQPNTRYYYELEVNGRLDRPSRGQFRTLPAPGPASFKIAFASCARTGSTSDVFDCVRRNEPLFFLHMGDFHYLDIQTNSPARFRAGYDTVLGSPQQSAMFRQVPLVYMWDDHDFGGNDSDRKSPVHKAARGIYAEYVPHYPLAFGEGDVPITQSFAVGRVKFIVTDLRSARDSARQKDDDRKSMLGAKQKEWFKQELLAANGRYPLICWVSTVPWIGQAGKSPYRHVSTNAFGYMHHSNLAPFLNTRTNRNPPGVEDHWAVFSAERRELADFIKANQIRGLCILHGDSHMLAADDGSNSDYATGGGAPLPVMCAAPLDQAPSLKGGPYSQGIYRLRPDEGCFGLLTVTDQGGGIDVAYSGRNNRNEEKVALKFSVPAEKR